MREVEWEKVEKGSENAFMTLEVGANNVRVLNKKPIEVEVHFVETKEGNKRVICPGSGCPLCKMNSGPKTRYSICVFDRKSKSVKVLEHGKKIFGDLKDLLGSEEWGDLRTYDVDIKRKGTTKNDTSYTVIPMGKKKLTPDEMAYIKQNMIKLSEVYEPTDAKEVEKVIREAKSDSSSEADDLGELEKELGSEEKKSSKEPEDELNFD